MQHDSPEFQKYQKLLDDHRALKTLLGQIDQALTRRETGIPAVSKLLGELGDRLVKHFAVEEKEGYFADILLHAPQLVARANELMAQHPKMCTAADTLLQLSAAEENAESWWQTTRQRFEAFRRELLLHEKSEDGLLQEAFSQDIGSHD
jgi:uncharacterized protein YyaL (SSP411 family)